MAVPRKRLAYFENWVDPVAEEILAQHAAIDVRRLKFCDPEDATWGRMSLAHGYQVLPRGDLIEPWFANEHLIKRSPNLLAVCSTGSGYDMIDVDACTRAGIIVCHQSGTNKEAVAEHVLGLMLSLSKKIALTDRLLRRGAPVDRFSLSGNDLLGKTVGVVGMGQIGTRVAELCRGLLKMQVLACDPYLDEHEIEARGGAKTGLGELLGRSDFVSVHCPRNAETLGMFKAPQFAAMKRTAFFIATARGGIHDEGDLFEALKANRIAGAGVDVFLREPPPPEHPLLSLDNVIATPHSAGVTAEALQEMARAAATQWVDIFAGRIPPRLVNPAAWTRYSDRFSSCFGIRPAPLLS
jgi:D-3-phosphoglycerate dehydrogenase / 2-oxoglutarate reductase